MSHPLVDSIGPDFAAAFLLLRACRAIDVSTRKEGQVGLLGNLPRQVGENFCKCYDY